MIVSGNVLTVSDVNNFVKSTLESNENLKYIYIKGEISNLKRQANGHLYFSLKDENSVVSAMMFAGYANKLVALPKDGDTVLVLGSISVYLPRGSYSINVYELEAMGLGEQFLELEKLKKKLASEGLFDASRKRNINMYPKRIGVVTAPNGAAIKDILINLERRYPLAEVYVFPSLVQGADAPISLVKAVSRAETYDLDTLIIGRGGGASEDLSAFNDETLVRKIADCPFPVIAAVGHEVDLTLVDFVADKRASTPTGACEVAVVDINDIIQRIDESNERLTNGLTKIVEEYNDDVTSLKERLSKCLNNMITNVCLEFKGKKDHLAAISPKGILKRGYSLTVNRNGKVIKSKKDININDEIVTFVSDGEIKSIIKEK